jgi:hypothetical protein
MVLAATVMWIVGMIAFFIFGLSVPMAGEFNDMGPFNKYLEEWGWTRFYTLYFFILIICVPIWPLILVGIWIFALIKGW